MPDPWADWLPSVADVGAVLRARTVDPDGNELGTFTDATRPTGVQVAELIAGGVADVYGEVGIVPDVLLPQARRVSALGTAILVELSYYPEQTNSARSAYVALRDLYETHLKRLTVAVGEVQSGDLLGLGDDPPLPQFGGMTGDIGGIRAPGASWPWSGPGRAYDHDNQAPLGFGTRW
jgi:hypothetical protein